MLFSRSRSISMGQIYRFLGLDTGLIQDGMSTSDQRTAIMLTLHMWQWINVWFFYIDNMALNLDVVYVRLVLYYR
jgi:preprotein translocase subunit SecA